MILDNIVYDGLRKNINDIRKKAYNISKLNCCLCCGKRCNSFCNSHTLPRFILKNISKDGHLYNWNVYSKLPIDNESKGVNNSCTFRRICHDCDNRLFQYYESMDSLMSKEPDNKMLAQIDLKNCLKMYDRRLIDDATFELLKRTCNKNYQNKYFDGMRKIFQLDIDEIKNDIQNDLNIISGEGASKYNVVYRTKLNMLSRLLFKVVSLCWGIWKEDL